MRLTSSFAFFVCWPAFGVWCCCVMSKYGIKLQWDRIFCIIFFFVAFSMLRTMRERKYDEYRTKNSKQQGTSKTAHQNEYQRQTT